jgi:hypothetical protein
MNPILEAYCNMHATSGGLQARIVFSAASMTICLDVTVSTLQVGQRVLAIGNAFGLSQTLTQAS